MRLALALAVLVALTAPARAATSELPGRAGMYPQNATTTTTPSLALVESHIDATIHGAIVEVVVRQTFRNDADHVTEATYIFPLPDDAAVTAMAITSGTRTIHAEIAKRADAQKRYEDAVTAGVGAALLEQERPDVFTQTVSAIAAHGTVEITLRYDTLARPRGDGSWQLVLPMVVAPRYVPGTASGRPTTGAGHAPDTDRAPDASRVTPGAKPGAGGSTEIALAFADAVEAVTSPTHDLVARGTGYTLGDAHSDHDALIRWRTKQPESGWVEQDDDGGYAAAVIGAPPGKPRAPGGAALDVALVLDRSAVARGDADATERPLVRELLASLTPADGVIVTGSATQPREAPADAWRDLERAWATSPGAFDLTRALHATHGAAIVLVTPGLVADDTAALAAARALHAPVHVIGVGPAPNRALLFAIARDTGGTIRFVTGDDDVAAVARDVLADLTSPPPALAISWGTLAASDVVPATLPRLGAGQARLVLARVQRAQAANGRAQGDVFALAMTTKPPAITGELTPRGPLARRWARDKLAELIDATPTRTPDVAAVTALALRYGLVSPYTSMVAIGDQVVVRGGVRHTVSVPVSVPAGMRWQPLEQELRVATKGDRLDKKENDNNDKAEEHSHEREVDQLADRNEPTPTTPKGPVVTQKAPARPSPRPTTNSKHSKPSPPAAPPAAAPPPPPAQSGASVADHSDPDDASGKDLDEDDRPVRKNNKRAESGDGDDDSAETGAQEFARPHPKSVALDTSSEGDELDGMVSERSIGRRYALALGGGLTLTDPRALVAIAASVESHTPFHRALPRYGVEATLWLVGGLHAQERLLATLAWQLDRTSLGFGVGAHVSDSDGVPLGPAVGLVLRREITRGISGYLRYDGALLYFHDQRTSEHAASAGVELRW